MNTIVVTSTKQNIKFGYEGEDNVTKIIFPYDESWLEYGEGNFEVRILRCGDEVAYTATEVVDDRQAMTLTMTVTDIELSVRGRGEMQLCYVCPDSIKKSPIYQYTVNRSVDYKYAVDPPEGSIIASVEKSLSEIKNTTNRLSNSVISIESSINDVNSQIDNINNKISEFDEEIDSVGEVETKVDNLETSIESINGRINTAEGNINENTESISDLNESVTELENRKVTDLETSGGKSDSGKYLTVGTDGKIKATSLTIPPTITVDESLSTTSENPVQNKVIKTELNNINSNIETCNTEISKINGSLGDVKADLSEINNYNTYDVLSEYTGTNGTIYGVTYAFNGNKCTTTGATETSASFRNVYGSRTALPTGLKAGDNIFIKVKTTNENVKLAIFYYSSNGQIGSGRYIAHDRVETIPNNCIGMIVRIDVPANVADASSVIEYAILANYQLQVAMKSVLDNNTDANNLIESSDNGVYLIDSNRTYLHLPVIVGFLFNYITSYNTILQLVYDRSTTNVYMRHMINSTWSDWVNISGVTNNYTFEQYENTYNITSSPTITTNTNAYLAPSGDTTDRTADIVSMLTSQGICRLGKGDYYVNNLEMPNETTIKGVGDKTRIILSGTSAGFAIKMKSYCTVSDCLISGKTSSITLSDILDSESTVPLRHGILWQGTYTQDQSTANQPINGMISNVRFLSFTGGAITCYDTGYGTFNALEVSNVFCMNCNVGINVSYWSEFHKFTNVRTASCYYGCINNGGNNVFTNCDFSTCKIGFLMDNSTGQSPNNSHGSCVACVFNHTDNNTGVGIKILNCDNGFIFDGCQIFYSQTYIEDSDGVVFANCNYGETNCNITISGGGAILFNGNMYKTTPTKTITNNSNVHFVNCYVKSTGAVVN